MGQKIEELLPGYLALVLGPPMVGAAGGAGRSRRRCWRRRSKPVSDTGMDALVASADNATSSAAAHCLHEPDPLVLELCVSTGPHEWVYPMLEEFATSRIVSRPLEASALGCPLGMSTAPQDEEASLVDTSSPAKAWTTGLPMLSPEQPPVMPQWVGHPVEDKA
jgi:hypothetical protein